MSATVWLVFIEEDQVFKDETTEEDAASKLSEMFPTKQSILAPKYGRPGKTLHSHHTVDTDYGVLHFNAQLRGTEKRNQRAAEFTDEKVFGTAVLECENEDIATRAETLANSVQIMHSFFFSMSRIMM